MHVTDYGVTVCVREPGRFHATKSAIEFLSVSFGWIRRFRSETELKSQLKRAAMCITLNVAEGAGKNRRDDRARFFIIARGFAMECAAIIDVCKIAELISDDEAKAAKQLLVRIVSMLTNMAR